MNTTHDVDRLMKAFQAEQFRQLIAFVCNYNYLPLGILVALTSLAITTGSSNPMLDWMFLIVGPAGIILMQKGLMSESSGLMVCNFCVAFLPVLDAIFTTAEIAVFKCGGTCDTNQWTHKIHSLMLVSIFFATSAGLPWVYLFWTRISVIVLMAVAYYHLVLIDETMVWSRFSEPSIAALFLLFNAWKQETLARKAFELQHAESTTILGSVSHDLRTPLSVVRYIVSYLSLPNLSNCKLGDAKIQAELAKATHGCTLIDGLVEDLLFASTMYNTDSDGIILAENSVNIRKFIDTHVSHVQYKLKKNVVMSIDINEHVPSIITIDEKRLSQVITNLLTNACKFTLHGDIKLACTLVSSPGAQSEGVVTLKFAVQDSGIGISKDDAKKLKPFQLFSKLRNTVSDRLNINGTGLGLYICHQLAVKLGGTLDFTSTAGIGSVFWCTVQARSQGGAGDNPRHAHHVQLKESKALSILIVDDDQLLMETLRLTLEDENLQTTAAKHGGEALALVRARKFDCIIMDCNMPIMDGFECTRQIRALEQSRAGIQQRTPILGHTANAQTEYVAACTAAGMDMVIGKGCSQSTFKAHILKCIGAEVPHDSGLDTGAAIATTIVPKDCCSPLDLTKGEENMGSLDIYLPFVQQVVSAFPDALRSIEEARKAHDLKRLGDEAHKLKGKALFAQAPALIDATFDLQQIARSEKWTTQQHAGNTEQVKQACSLQLRRACDRVVEEASRVSRYLEEISAAVRD
jgi:signal transduction histidine kinase/HPt (histidine-containing phosphotransfer) domain-containing protein/AmiR/NasT family two-component response regulator